MESQHTEETSPERHTPDLAGRTTRTTTTTTTTSGGNISEGTDRVNDSGNNTETSVNDRHDYRFDIIPESLKDLPQWGVWRREYTDGRPNNVPYDAKTGNHLSVTDPGTWSPFDVALEAYRRGIRGQWDGLSVALKEGGGVVGIDLDDCMDEGGDFTPEAQEIITLWDSYVEYSPSRRGLRGFALGTLPAGRRKVGDLEIYDSAKALTVTGWRLPDMPTTLNTHPDALRKIHQKFFSKPKKQPATGTFDPDDYEPLSDDDVIDIATRAKNGARVQALIDGDFAGYASNSEADLAACNFLAFYCGPDSYEQIDRIFRARFTGFRPAKWEKRHYANGDSYGERTVQVALEGRTEFYTRPRTKAASGAGTHEDEARKDDLPTTPISTDITKVVNEAEAALLTLANGPHLFQRIGQLCFVTHSATPPQWLKRPVGAPSIASCSPAQLRERMSRAAKWVKWTARSKEWTPALPPEWAVETLHGRREWGFPILADIVSAPTLREDGALISTPGYDPDTGLFLYTQGVIFPPIPTRPTLDEARRAVKALMEPFADFPFAGPHGMSAILSAILSLVARPAINGCVPLFAVDSTTRGIGKGLLIDCVTVIATGRPAPRWAQSRDEEEDRKGLLTIGLEGDPCVHIDNLTHALGSGPLDSALTAGTIKGRLLGQNKSAEVPITSTFFVSGNNINFAGDMARRVVPIHLESLLERPEDRDDFQQPQLLDWVRKERPRLVVEALTILRAYFVADCPKQKISAYGSFEAWSNLVRAALVWAGCPDPCEGRKGIEAASDPGYENLASLLHLWEACYPSEAVTLNRVIGDVGLRSEDPPPHKWRDLREALAAFDSRYDGKRLDGQRIGNALRAQKGRVIDGLRLIQAGKLDHAAQWVVQKV